MRTTLLRLGPALPAGAAMLILVACGSTSTPTAPAEAVPAMKAAAPAAAATAAVTASVTVRGSVVDSSNRPLPNIIIECLGDVACTRPEYQPSAQGHEHRVETTDAKGSYELVATSQSGSTASAFSMNANGPTYLVAWRQVEWPDPACTSDQARCTVTVNFTLTPSTE